MGITPFDSFREEVEALHGLNLQDYGLAYI